jgi:AhpD family alkylhydroperoxidase
MARMNVTRTAPEGYRAVLALERYVKERVDGRLLELIKVRASVLNNCAFCVDMHTTEALGAGEDLRRIVALTAWRESPFFTDAERAALDLTDAVTRLGEEGVPDGVWDRAVGEHGEAGVADLLFAIATINVWNRLMVATQAPPPPLAASH